MLITNKNLTRNFDQLKFSNSWNLGDKLEPTMHRIHVYPAKFPSFLVNKTIKHIENRGAKVNTIADIFCGCGTTALEAKLNGLNFWGCDINPVATLVAKVKSQDFSTNTLLEYFKVIKNKYSTTPVSSNRYLKNERITYWFEREQIDQLAKLLKIINRNLPKSKYRYFFLVAFSNILKGTSRWLTKSIKPTIDKSKKPNNVWSAFERQFEMMLSAVSDLKRYNISKSSINIENKNFLSKKIRKPFVDLLVTSPPYVTSYEYADLHQLSTLLLGYTKDYKNLRNGTIGSLYHKPVTDKDINSLNLIGKSIYYKLCRVNKYKSKSVVKYFIDINKTLQKSFKIIKKEGYIAIVIGNTTYRDVKIDNAKYVMNCMLDIGFTRIELIKRRVSSKILTPYRDKDGKFSADKRKRKIYAHEYIIISKKQ